MSLVLLAIEDGLARITLNRPEKLNALSVESFHELNAHIDTIQKEKVGCVLLTGAGRSFCAGHDLEGISSGSEDDAAGMFETRTIERLATLPMPVVAAVRGHCYTGGLELVLAADIIIAAEDAKFADTHAKWDLTPIWGLSQRLPRRIGEAKAYEMFFASRTYSGADAAAMGLANFVVPNDGFEAEVDKFCGEVLANAWRATRAFKTLVARTEGMSLHDGIVYEIEKTEGRGPEMHDRLARMRKK
ncbi:enoyl-CoA hydratase/isomerase family protein [Sphingobium sp. Sx8-8]|uniref:enoyl-CoA hydratase/isomerase family protein n=1 Tax=Sphingobium sp. Sx8-8 TaxID=2933617 RepID=UPI001F5AC0A4|nr:enoyl-CoA hydratase/isomerase family protein [Sphingobium sp. Sx8-8]